MRRRRVLWHVCVSNALVNRPCLLRQRLRPFPYPSKAYTNDTQGVFTGSPLSQRGGVRPSQDKGLVFELTRDLFLHPFRFLDPDPFTFRIFCPPRSAPSSNCFVVFTPPAEGGKVSHVLSDYCTFEYVPPPNLLVVFRLCVPLPRFRELLKVFEVIPPVSFV